MSNVIPLLSIKENDMVEAVRFCLSNKVIPAVRGITAERMAILFPEAELLDPKDVKRIADEKQSYDAIMDEFKNNKIFVIREGDNMDPYMINRVVHIQVH